MHPHRPLTLVVAMLAGCHGTSSPADLIAPSDLPSSSDLIGSSTTDASSPCGTRAGARDFSKRTIKVAGLDRTYLVYLPASFDADKPLPLVFVFHGYTMSGPAMSDITEYSKLADSEGIALAFPDGEDGPDSLGYPWNVKNAGQTVCGDGDSASADGDDFAFIDAMKADIADDQCVDTAHIYSTGFSMGGYFSEHIGCYRSDMRAIGPASGGTLADLASCTTGHVPVILFHGTADPLIDDACDDPTVTPDDGFMASATLWAQKNGCKPTFTTTQNSGSAGDGRCLVYEGCPTDGQVEVCLFTGMVHCGAGGAPDVDGNSCPTWASATELEWTFFKQYAW